MPENGSTDSSPDGAIEPFFTFEIPESDVPAAHAIGDIVGGWKLERLIAPATSESSAAVYEVSRPSAPADPDEQQHPADRAAMKIFTARGSMRRFRLQASILSELTHEHLVRVFEWGVDPAGFPFLVMDLVRGYTFDAWLESAKPAASVILEAIVQAAAAVGYAHTEAGLVHRDLKPANVLVEDGVHPSPPRARVIDFGVALLLKNPDSPQSSLATEGGAIVGTLAYMAPEQFYAGARTVDPRADVYSLGVMLYEALTGRRPVDTDGLSLVETAKRKEATHVGPQSIARLAANNGHPISRSLALVVAFALSPDPEDRPENASVFADEIRRALHGQALLHKRPGMFRRTRRFLAREPRVAAVLGLLALVATVSLIAISVLAIRAESARRAERAQTDRLIAMVKSWSQGAFMRSFQAPGSEAALVPVTEAVIKALEEASAIRPNDIEILDQLALSYAQLGSVVGTPAARSLGDEPRARTLHDQSIEAATRSAALYQFLNRPDAALARLSIANAIKRRVSVTPDAAERRALLEEAKKISDEVYRQQPDNESVVVSVAGTFAAWSEAQESLADRIAALDRAVAMLDPLLATTKRPASIRRQLMILHLTLAGELAASNPARAAKELQTARSQLGQLIAELSLSLESLNPTVPREAMFSRLVARTVMIDAQIAAAEHRWHDARAAAQESTRQTKSLTRADPTSGPSALDHATRLRERAEILLAAAEKEAGETQEATVRQALDAAADAIATIQAFMPERPRTYLEQAEIDRCRGILDRIRAEADPVKTGSAAVRLGKSD